MHLTPDLSDGEQNMVFLTSQNKRRPAATVAPTVSQLRGEHNER